MHSIPDIALWKCANDYQEVAELCVSHGLIRASAVNASLAIEIYLKCFTSEEVLKDVYNGMAKVKYSKSIREHNLLKLFRKIKPELREMILFESKQLDSNVDLLVLLKKYKDFFLCGRYAYEENSIPIARSEVADLAKHLRAVVEKIGLKLEV
ncbi:MULTISPECIES: hypothetical protein [Deefgea]|uniref:HEPN domain-containing protein n=1 Tax=Deefgea chitinilytica TaxID=570276 RepID=A0ABS2CFC9_9NEIS|nr:MULTISPECIES: hypothetical protein [Deefgea]MBM5572722.1 hypothetical protein [Deefgea chitinilytica]MBM9889958.1 hypothetical protein [Deefgea sp. CFH1-16]